VECCHVTADAADTDSEETERWVVIPAAQAKYRYGGLRQMVPHW
jgi:hypothetical protein